MRATLMGKHYDNPRKTQTGLKFTVTDAIKDLRKIGTQLEAARRAYLQFGRKYRTSPEYAMYISHGLLTAIEHVDQALEDLKRYKKKKA